MLRGPIQRAMCAGSTQARNTASRGASRMRVKVKLRSASFSTIGLAIIALLWISRTAQILAEAVETLVPETSLEGEPFLGLGQCIQGEPAAPVLAVPPSDEPCG
jgi:hypothetical protein